MALYERKKGSRQTKRAERQSVEKVEAGVVDGRKGEIPDP